VPEPLTPKIQHGLCRSCYKKEYQIKYRQSKRNATEIDKAPEDSTLIPPFKRSTFDLNADKQVVATSDNTQQSQICLYDEGLIAACGLEHESKQHQELMKVVLQTSSLEPFGIFLDHCEINAMATSRSIFTLLSAIPPK
jgi:predicted RNA-binding protein with PIN domain